MNLTLFIDIDGTILPFLDNPAHLTDSSYYRDSDVVKNSKAKLLEWHQSGFLLILTTGRPETMRAATEKMLIDLGLFHDQLVMGCSCGPRVLINDKEPNGVDKAYSVNLIRDEGIGGINLTQKPAEEQETTSDVEESPEE